MVKKYSDHLVFFIHGMGQQYEEYGRLEHHVLTMQNTTQQVLQQHYPDRTLRVHYVAIEWHSVIHGLVDEKMEQATLETVPKVRLATNHWLMDCLYYFSKPYGQCIIDAVCQQCNEAYRQHIARWSDFVINQGQVHMIGFSLGGVIGYDIASMQWTEADGVAPYLTAPANIATDPYHCRKPDLQVPLLDFQIRYLFTCGSPVAAALVFRGLDYKYYRPPCRTKFHNIFHPFDPLGYRIEPMLNQAYISIRPVRLTRAQRQRILPKIPDLGIRSSLAGARPLISKARHTFWQYMATVSSDSSTETATEDCDHGSTGSIATSDSQTSNITNTVQSSSSSFFHSPLSTCSIGSSSISINSMASPVVSTFSATMHRTPLSSTALTLGTMKKLLTVVPLVTTASALTSNSRRKNECEEEEESSNDDNDSDDDDFRSILLESTYDDGSVEIDDTESFITATTFDTLTSSADSLPTPTPSPSTSVSTQASTTNPTVPTSGIHDTKNHAMAKESVKHTEHTNRSYLEDDSEAKGRRACILATDGTIHPRLDYILTETVIDTYASEWIVALKSHFKYWANRDLVLHMVNVMLNEKGD